MSSTHTIALDQERLAAELAKRDGMTHYRLAKNAGLQQSTITRVLRGDSAPSPTFVASVLKALDLRFEDLFTAVPHAPARTSAA